jgi:Arc/MetJ family transcription regulator
MVRRTTIEIDEELLTRTQRALGTPTVRGTVEEALRRALASLEADAADRADRQRRYLARLSAHVDADVLASDQMWR